MKKLYVGNLPYRIGEVDIEEAFAKFGEVVDVNIIKDENGRSKGFGFVEFSSQAEAEKAIEELDGKELQGRPLRVSLARERRSGGGEGRGRSSSSGGGQRW